MGVVANRQGERLWGAVPPVGVGDQKRYRALIALKDGRYAMEEEVFTSSLQLLSRFLYKHYGKKAVIIIDEYDVTLDRAFQNGYYREMVSLIRGLFGQA